jgi:hypothetical protein
MILALAIAIPLLACVILALGIFIGLQCGRKGGYRDGRWNGLEEGYADAMRDGWLDTAPADQS